MLLREVESRAFPVIQSSPDQRAISPPSDLNFPKLLLRQRSKALQIIADYHLSGLAPPFSLPRCEKSGLEAYKKFDQARFKRNFAFTADRLWGALSQEPP